MKPIVRLTAFAIVVALSLAGAPPSSQAGAIATPTAKNCYFVRNHLPCPCPKPQEARALARAACVTVRALGTVIGKTAVALTRAEHGHHVPTDARDTSRSTQPAKH